MSRNDVTASLPQSPEGPPIYTNWNAFASGAPFLGASEYPLFTDARIIGEITCGPYEFINTVPIPRFGVLKPSVILRCAYHVDWPVPNMSRTDTDRYHGGSFPEELAALASLAIGARFRAGDTTRTFEPGGDPKGRPSEWGIGRISGTLRKEEYLGWKLPGAVQGEHNLELLGILKLVPVMRPSAAVTLIRAARLYQDALWLVEAEPSLAWLLLVSAIETAANHWRAGQGNPAERLRESKADLYEYLKKLGPAVVSEVALQIADTLGSTKKFVDFLIHFLPTAPAVRPAIPYQFDWRDETIRSAVRKIYRYRSAALHDGTPFAQPMCEPPFRENDAAPYSEKPLAVAVSSKGGVWLGKDLPMLFHFFEYIARNALIAWWKNGAVEEKNADAGVVR